MSESETTVTQTNTQENTNEVNKGSKSEKKFVKAMTKMGLKPVEGIQRVTFKTGKSFVMSVEAPTVMKISESSFAVFGEAKIFDPKSSMATKQAEKFKKAQEPIKEEEEENPDEGELELGNLKEEDVTNLISYANCTRNKAIKTLNKVNGDIVEAITLLSSN